MNTNEEWLLFERLADPEVSVEERVRLEGLIAASPESLKRYRAFQSMAEWQNLEPVPDSTAARSRLFATLAKGSEAEVTERELGRLFPMFFGGALAAVLVVALLNIWQFDDISGDAWGALFGIPAESVEIVIVSQL